LSFFQILINWFSWETEIIAQNNFKAEYKEKLSRQRFESDGENMELEKITVKFARGFFFCGARDLLK